GTVGMQSSPGLRSARPRWDRAARLPPAARRHHGTPRRVRQERHSRPIPPLSSGAEPLVVPEPRPRRSESVLAALEVGSPHLISIESGSLPSGPACPEPRGGGPPAARSWPARSLLHFHHQPA